MNFVLSRSQIILLLIAALAITGCSKPPASPVTSTPLVEPGAADAKPLDEFHGSFAPGGIQAGYRATFGEGETITIEETRQPTTSAEVQRGAYEFRGARLVKYQGAALGSANELKLEFDLQGKVLVARAGDHDVAAEEINAIRDRAQSLRSHAVARHAVRGHDKN